MKRFFLLTKAMFLLHVRNRATLFWNLAFPVFLLFIYSMVFGTSQVGDENYMTWVVPGVLVFNILAFGLLGSSALMVQMRENGVLRRLQASPVPALQLAGSYLLVNLFICILQSALIIAVSLLVFDVEFTPVDALRAAPMLMVSILTCLALGQVIGGLAPTSGVAIAVGQIVNFSQMFITDLVMPIQMMPDWIQKIAHYLPAYAIVRLVRPPLLGGALDPQWAANLLVVAAYTAAAAFFATRLFRWEPKN
jgi:ABC-2 type transport system permease protein